MSRAYDLGRVFAEWQQIRDALDAAGISTDDVPAAVQALIDEAGCRRRHPAGRARSSGLTVLPGGGA